MSCNTARRPSKFVCPLAVCFVGLFIILKQSPKTRGNRTIERGLVGTL